MADPVPKYPYKRALRCGVIGALVAIPLQMIWSGALGSTPNGSPILIIAGPVAGTTYALLKKKPEA